MTRLALLQKSSNVDPPGQRVKCSSMLFQREKKENIESVTGIQRHGREITLFECTNLRFEPSPASPTQTDVYLLFIRPRQPIAPWLIVLGSRLQRV